MKDHTVYLLYNTNASNIKLQKEPAVGKFEKDSFVWDYVDKDKFTIMYNAEDIRKSTEVRILSKTRLRNRPQSAGELMSQPKGSVEGIFIKKSISLTDLEDFFLKRRIPVIKPLFSEREILKLQHLQEECRKKHVGYDDRSKIIKDWDEAANESVLQKSASEDILLRLEDEKTKKTRDVTSPLLDSKDKRKGVQSDLEKSYKLHDKTTEDGNVKGTKTPSIFKKINEPKKWPKDKTLDNIKDSKEKDKTKIKKESKSGTDPKRMKSTSETKPIKSETKTTKSENKTIKDGLKTSKSGKETEQNKTKQTKSGTKTTKSYEDTEKNKTKRSKSETISANSDNKTEQDKSKPAISEKKSKEKKSQEKIKSVHSLDQKKESHKQSSKQKIKSNRDEKENSPKEASENSKEASSHGKKSEKSVRTKSAESIEKSDSPKTTRKEKNKKDRDKDVKDQTSKMKKQSDQQKSENADGSEKATSKPGTSKEGKKIKPETASERTSDTPAKVKSNKDPESKKSVKFSGTLQHIIHYVLSNPLFIKFGWTLGPSDRAQTQVITFRAFPATPNTYCFRERTEDEVKFYSKSSEQLAYHFRTDGTGDIYYPNGVPAVVVTKHVSGMRLTLYADPKNDPLISGSFIRKVLGVFDSSGNGVIYDMQGRKVLNFNQLEGIYFSPLRSSPYKWQWCDYKILERQRIKALLRFMAKEQKKPIPEKKVTTPGSAPKKVTVEKKPEVDEAYEQILAELPYPVAQKSKVKSESHYWGFKPITLKINNEMTLRINGQDNIAIHFTSNKIFHRIDLGVKIDPDTVERIEEVASERMSDVPCVFDALLNLSPSLQKLNYQLSLHS